MTTQGRIQKVARGEWRRLGQRRRRRPGRARVESSAVGARIEAPREVTEVGCGEEVSPPHRRKASGKGLCPSPEFFLRYWSSKRRVLVHSGTDKTYFRSAWRLDFWAISRLGGDRPLRPRESAPVTTAGHANDTTANSGVGKWVSKAWFGGP